MTIKAPSEMVGRGAQLDRLGKLMDTVSCKKGRIVFIAGEAGTGKTALVETAAARATANGWEVLTGRCIFNEGTDPYLPFLDAFREHNLRKERRALASESAGTGPARDDTMDAPVGLMGIDAGFGRTTGPGAPDAGQENLRRSDLGRRRDRMFEELSSALLEIARDRPLLFFLDDLHRADNASVQLLGYISRNLSNQRVLIAAAYRPEELTAGDGAAHPLSETLRRIQREGVSETIELGPLGLEGTGRMLALRLGVASVPEKFTKMIFEKTEGNPFFIEETVHSLAERGILDVAKPDCWQKLDTVKIELPASIRVLLSQRVGRLDGGALRILEVAAVAGDHVRLDVLRAMTEMGEDQLIDHIDRLIKSQVLTEEAAPGHDSYAFTHSMLREVVYESISRLRRKLLHRRAAAAIETLAGDRPGEMVYALAYHFSNSGDLAKSVRYLTASGHRAVGQYAFDEALGYYRSALEAAGKLEHSPENDRLREELLLCVGNIQYNTGDWTGAIAVFSEAIALSERTGNTGAVALSNLRLGAIHDKRSEWENASERLDRALGIYTAANDSPGVAAAHLTFASMWMRRGDYRKAITFTVGAIGLFDPVRDKGQLAGATISLANVYNEQGDHAKAEEMYLEAEKLSIAADEPLELARVYNNIGDIRMRQERHADGIPFLEKSLKAGQRSGNIRMTAYILSNLGECLTYTGTAPDRALECLDRAGEIFSKLDERLMTSRLMMVRGIIHRNRKEYDHACERALESIRVGEELNIPFALAEYTLEYGTTLRLKGDLGQSRRLLEKAARIFKDIGSSTFFARSERELGLLGGSPKTGPDISRD